MKRHLFPPSISDLAQLEDLLSTPSDAVLATIKEMEGDFLILGAGGKMGPSLSRMIRRALDTLGKKARVIAVSRFSSAHFLEQFLRYNIETLRADLLNQEQLDSLPDVSNIVYMAGMKFGASGNQSLTWAMNTYLPGMVCEKFRHSRIVAFSSGNIYGLSSVADGGSSESGPLDPSGDYAMSILGRERIFEHFSRVWHIPVSLIRLNYAVEMRYGVLVDIASKVMAGEAIDLSMANANVIWQGDANAMAIASLDRAASPPFVLNVTGPETLSVRAVAQQFAAIFDKEPVFEGAESGTALLNNASLAHRLYGYPRVSLQQIIQWTADWLARGQPTHNKPTHFETRDGKF